jgi:ribosomal protein S18 acetylase RimI-like enzyme
MTAGLEKFLQTAEFANYQASFSSNSILATQNRYSVGTSLISIRGSADELTAVGHLVIDKVVNKSLGFNSVSIEGLAFAPQRTDKKRLIIREKIVEKILSLTKNQNTNLLVCRIRGDDLRLYDVLKRQDFIKVDSLRIYHYLLGPKRAYFERISNKNGVDLAQVLALVEKGVNQMEHGRLFADLKIPRSLATKIYLEISEKYIKSGAHVTVLKRPDSNTAIGVAIGFVDESRSRAQATQYGVLWLIVIDPEFVGRGFGHQLFSRFCEEFGQVCDLLEIGTQVQNESAQRIYENSGAYKVGTALTFHKWL